MDETMRIIIAYAELVFGFPLLVAKIIWFVPSVILTKILVKIAGRVDQIVDAAVEGFIAILLACLVFDRLGLKIVWAVPLILIVVNALWDWAKDESFRAWSFTAGIILGFIIYPLVVASLVDKFDLLRLLLS